MRRRPLRKTITRTKKYQRRATASVPVSPSISVFELLSFVLLRSGRRAVHRWQIRVYFFLLNLYRRWTPVAQRRTTKTRTIKLSRKTGDIFLQASKRAWLPQLRFPKLRWPQFQLPQPRLHRPTISLPAVRYTPPRPPWRLAISFIATGLIVGGAYGTYDSIFRDLPQPTELSQRPQPLTTKIRDRNGHVLFRVYDDENRTLVGLNQVSPYLIQATIAIEDQHFYQHKGISVTGITRAIRSNLQGQRVQGGSTITQQLVKNRLLSPERTMTRKLKEAVLALLVENTYSKDEILEMYLNQVAYGGSTYGIEAAAQRYFDKQARQLTLAEASLLAGLPQAPSVYTPYGATPERAKQRQAEVLRRMVEDGYITPLQAEDALNQPLALKTDRIEIEAPHFVMYVRQLLTEKYGSGMIETAGLDIITTLDLPLQHEAQQKVSEEVNKLKPMRISNGAALVTNPGTGEILAMVGSTNYFDFEHDGQVNVTLAQRQPGSSIKPITYSLAFERGLTPSSLIEDTPITYHIPGSRPYAPRNYDGQFHGRVSLREALASSYNIPAVKLLASVGVTTMIDKAEQMGISTWQDRARFGLSLTLGGGEVTMADLAEVYGTFANYGDTVELNPILEIRDTQGRILYRNQCALDNLCSPRKTLDTRVAYQITDILSDNNARAPAFGTQSVLAIPEQQVAVKTGTTNSLRDNWTIGYTSDRLVAVWVGNNDNTPMSYVASGITGASPIWNNIMRLVLDEQQPHYFATPDSLGLIKVAICASTGTLPCSACPVIQEEYFVPGTQPTLSCNPEQFVSQPIPPSRQGG